MQITKRAFTLTELLVVVVVIGVLAAVVLPRFSKILETRKTTEAESIMRAVRTEQERRCSLDKNYLANLAAMSDIVPTRNSTHYVYTGLTGGVTAQSKGSLNYQLQIPSYADGRICCSGNDCEKLNKDYPLCDDLIARVDYVPSPANCAADVGETPDPAQCGPQPADDIYDCCAQEGLIGTKHRSYVCNPTAGAWEPTSWQGSCSPVPAPQTTTTSITCDNGEQGTRTCTTIYRCDGSSHQDCTVDCGCFELVWENDSSGSEGGSCPPGWQNSPWGACEEEGAVTSGIGCLYPNAPPSAQAVYYWTATCTKVPCRGRWVEHGDTGGATHGYCSCPVIPEGPSGNCVVGSTTTWEECLNPNHPNPPSYSGEYPSGEYCGFDYVVHHYKCQ